MLCMSVKHDSFFHLVKGMKTTHTHTHTDTHTHTHTSGAALFSGYPGPQDRASLLQGWVWRAAAWRRPGQGMERGMERGWREGWREGRSEASGECVLKREGVRHRGSVC